MSDYDVTLRPDGSWQATTPGASRPSAVRPTQAEAYDAARDFAGSSGGGEVRIHGTDGRIRNSNTIGRPDPDPPRDTRHERSATVMRSALAARERRSPNIVRAP